MAHSLSAKKRIRQNIKRRAQNRHRKDLIKADVKAYSTALAGGDLAKAETALRQVTKRLDQISTKGTIHRKTASRKRSRLALRLNAAKAGAGTKAAKA